LELKLISVRETVLLVLLLVEHPVVGHHGGVHRERVVQVGLSFVLLKVPIRCGRMVVRCFIDLIMLLKEDRVASLGVVLNMLSLLGVVHPAVMVVSLAGLVVKHVTLSLLSEAHHLLALQVSSCIACSETISLIN